MPKLGQAKFTVCAHCGRRVQMVYDTGDKAPAPGVGIRLITKRAGSGEGRLDHEHQI